jgi:hypothetical protein
MVPKISLNFSHGQHPEWNPLWWGRTKSRPSARGPEAEKSEKSGAGNGGAQIRAPGFSPIRT